MQDNLLTFQPRLLLIDGCNLLFQMFFGMPARIIGKQGKPIQGVLGFIGALRKIIGMVQPSHVAVIFDSQCQNARAELDQNYKSNRIDYSTVPEEDNPFSQLDDIYKALNVLGIAHCEANGCECDDIIASYALQCGDTDIVISSFDSDFFQLIGPHVRVLRYRGEKTVICDTQYINQKFGIAPAMYADFKCLTGDKADNIAGVPGVGPKTAASLINTYGSLQGVIDHADEIAKPALRQSVAKSADRLQVNLQLIKLQGNEALPFVFDQMQYIDKGLTTTQVLQAIDLK